MTDIHIIDQDLNIAADLADLLARRRLSVTSGTTSPEEKVAAVVASRVYEEANGQRAVVDFARTAGAQKIIIVDEVADQTGVAEELGGRLVRVALPASNRKDNPLRDGWLLMLADLIGTETGAMVAADQATGTLIDLATRVAKTDVTVFVNGPTGSGKEVLGRLVHSLSRRAGNPFVAINCAAIPENMLEAILFGHEKGAFTGASTANKGIVRAADGGTLMLDEISEMPMGLQAKLLRVLQEKTVTPLGSQKEVPVDVRIIATSNRDMMDEVKAGNFREDLYYRLNVFPLSTMALADRPDDIPALAVTMIRRHCPADIALPALTDSACDALLAHDWPGNVRELENIMQRALVLHQNGEITADDIMITATDGLMPMPTPAPVAADAAMVAA